jgi:acetylornithine/succinyldiaminopimelate/putrescine aminotransferase
MADDGFSPMTEITDQDVDNLMHMAAGYAVWCVGMSDEAMMNLLHHAHETLRTDLARRFGDDIANVIAEAFPAAVVSARRALEANGGTPGVLN